MLGCFIIDDKWGKSSDCCRPRCLDWHCDNNCLLSRHEFIVYIHVHVLCTLTCHMISSLPCPSELLCLLFLLCYCTLHYQPCFLTAACVLCYQSVVLSPRPFRTGLEQGAVMVKFIFKSVKHTLLYIYMHGWNIQMKTGYSNHPLIVMHFALDRCDHYDSFSLYLEVNSRNETY